MNSQINIRAAKIEDAARLLEIYSYYVKETAITYEYEVPSLDEFRTRLKHIPILLRSQMEKSSDMLMPINIIRELHIAGMRRRLYILTIILGETVLAENCIHILRKS